MEGLLSRNVEDECQTSNGMSCFPFTSERFVIVPILSDK